MNRASTANQLHHSDGAGETTCLLMEPARQLKELGQLKTVLFPTGRTAGNKILRLRGCPLGGVYVPAVLFARQGELS